MIIEVSESLIENRKDEKDFNLFLFYILLSYKEGKHLILISKDQVMNLLRDEEISKNIEQNLLDYLYNAEGFLKEYFQENLRNKFNYIISIVPDNEKYKITQDKNIETRTLKINDFLDSSNIQKTIFLGEHLSDANVYNLIAKFYMKENKIYDNFKLRYDNMLGGGDSTGNVFKEIYENEEKFCLAILDSDKISPENDIGDTAKKVKNFVESMEENKKNNKCHCIVLDYLELENIIPFEFYKSRNNIIYEELYKLRNIDKEIIKYFDFKKGIKKKDKPAYNKYWAKLLNNENFKINGFGSKILSEFIKLDYEKISKIVKNDKEIKAEWLKLGKTITSFLLGAEKRLF